MVNDGTTNIRSPNLPDIFRLDVSILEPPHPMTEITKVLSGLPMGGLLRVSHRRKPAPLFEIIQSKYLYRHVEIDEGKHLIFIWHRDDADTTEYVRTRSNENDWT
ncbi:DUF2249 domain-containing protein [Vibrio sp. VB16]|uniref:DUF2249 domain-containing protein n=1 Tax=Vibrio sp. VB16 TaxID=2785746 RepID=UPI00189CAA61|nr:DUF2249 domain-containing protein [Vibrio sp. VB16]UGA57281.1 DUF2249 domain-containing protein [Vibrio sp. VB16]